MMASAMVWIMFVHAAALSLALPIQSGAASCPSEVCGSDPEGGFSLLQHDHRAGGRRLGAEKAAGASAAAVSRARVSSKRAVAFEGGGFVAQADYFGVVAGLLHALPSVLGEQAGHDLGALFERFDTLVGVSGGSWFASQLVYSQKFNDLLSLSARAPNQTALTLQTKYYAPVLNPTTNTSIEGTVQGIKHCLIQSLPLIGPLLEAALFGSNDSSDSNSSQAPFDVSSILQTLYESKYYLPWMLEAVAQVIILIQSGSITWEDLVVQMFHRGAEIDPSMSLGSDAINAWAKGKLYMQGVTAMTPSPDANTFGAGENFTRVILEAPDAEHALLYTASGRPSDQANRTAFTAAKFSVVLGAGAEQDSPQPFCATEDCFGLELNYLDVAKQTSTAVGLADAFHSSFELSAGLLPVGSTAGVSSAFKGKEGVEGALGAKQGCADLAVWAAAGVGGGRAFEAGGSLRSQLFNPLAPRAKAKAIEGALQPLTDGGDTDYTGIGHALASGAEEILTFVNVGEGTMELGSLTTIFEGDPNPQRVLFSEPTLKDLQARVAAENFTIIPALPGSRFLQRIIFGSISAVTADNPWFGISAGRKVELGFIAVDTANITIGLISPPMTFNSFFNFGFVSEEVAATLASKDNEGATRDMLRKFFV